MHDWFNHKDISHVIMAISLIVIYKGVKLKITKYSPENVSGSFVSTTVN